MNLNTLFPLQKKLNFVTHSGSFHVDDIFAAATLSLVFQAEGYDFEIHRTRDGERIKSADIVFDVGGIYEPSTFRFDHHQVPGPEARSINQIPYSSFGLVWKHFGMVLCDNDDNVWKYIEENLALAVDAQDNGVELYKCTNLNIHPVLIHQITRAFVPTWREREEGSGDDSAFFELVTFAMGFLNRMIIVARDMYLAEKYVQKIYDESEDKTCIVLDRDVSFEDALEKFPEPRLVIHPRIAEGGATIWRIQTVRDDVNGFANRCPLPEAWRGKMGTDLETITGVIGAQFCHKAGFLAIAQTREAAILLAKIALKQNGQR